MLKIKACILRAISITLILIILPACSRNAQKTLNQGEIKENLYYFTYKNSPERNDSEGYFTFKRAVYQNGKIINEESLTTFRLNMIISAFYKESENRLKVISHEGDYLSIDPANGEKTRPYQIDFGEYLTYWDWSDDGEKFLYSRIMGDAFSYVRSFNTDSTEEISNALPFVNEWYQNGVELIIFSAAFLPGSNGRKIAGYGMATESTGDDDVKAFGIFFIYDLDKNKIVFEKRDYGVFDSTSLYVGVLAAHLDLPAFALSSDGKKAVYFADFKKSFKEKSKKGNARDDYYQQKHKTLGAWVIDLEDEKKKPKLITDNLTYTAWASWSPDGKYLIISGQLFEVEDNRFTPVKVKEKFACGNVKYTGWSKNSQYFVSHGGHPDWDSYLFYLPKRRVAKFPKGAIHPFWAD